MADLAEEVGADVQDVARGVGLDNRIGSKFLHAGPGFGGSCFPKDTRALLQTAHDYDVPLRIVEAVIAANGIRKRAMARKVSAAFGGALRGKTIAVLGLTFKPNTDDIREAPSIPLITALQDMGALVRAFDPVGMEHAKAILPNVVYCDGPYTCADGSDGVVIVTEWEQFRALDFNLMKQRMACPLLVDLRNIYSSDEMEQHGFLYVGIGRKPGRGRCLAGISFPLALPNRENKLSWKTKKRVSPRREKTPRWSAPRGRRVETTLPLLLQGILSQNKSRRTNHIDTMARELAPKREADILEVV
jgi:hypothetical protein